MMMTMKIKMQYNAFALVSGDSILRFDVLRANFSDMLENSTVFFIIK